MSTRQIRKRLERLAQRFDLRDDATITLEQLCRDLWRADKQRYLAQCAGKPSGRHFITQFEREDAERNRAERPGKIEMVLNLRRN